MTSEVIVITADGTFDYGQLDTAARIVVQQKTGEIRERVDTMRRSAAEIGQRLREVKAQLDHGQWGDWLEREFHWSDQTALNYMNVAGMSDENPKFLEFEDRFAKSALTALAAPSVPMAARQEALALAESGEKVTSTAAQQLIAKHKPDKAPPADDAPHLPADFQATQARAKKLSLYISMNAGGKFTMVFETGARAVAGSNMTWAETRARLETLEREKAAPPTQTTLPGTAPVLTPRPAGPPPLLTPLTPAPQALAGDAGLIQAYAALTYCRKLATLAQRAWDELTGPHLAQGRMPVVTLDEAQAEAAARMALSSPALRAQAGMLTFGAQLAWDQEGDAGETEDEETIA